MFRLMLFFPSVTFGLLSAEIFPWAAAYASARLKTISYRLIPLAAVMLLSVALAFYHYDGRFAWESLRSVFAYANPLLLLMVLARTSDREILRLVKILKSVLVVLLGLGIVQSSVPVEFLDPFFKALLQRGGATEFGGGRGVMLLSTEPSRAAFEMIFLYAGWRTITTLSQSKLALVDILFVLFVVGLIKSATGLALISLYLLLISRLKSILFLLLLVPVALFMFGEVRAMLVIVDLESKTSLLEAFEFVLNASGFRLVSVLSAYYYGFTSFFGGYIGVWPISSIDAMQVAGFRAEDIQYFVDHSGSEFASIRPTSYMANIALDMGVPGIFCLIYLLTPYLKRAWACCVSLRPLLGLFLFSLFFYGSVGNPVPWLALMLATRYCEIRNSHSNSVCHAL